MQAVYFFVWLVCFVAVTTDVLRSPATSGTKVLWSVLAFFFSLITLIVWFAWGRKRAYSSVGLGS